MVPKNSSLADYHRTPKVTCYENKGLKVKLVAKCASTRGFVGIQAESDAFWTLTKGGLVQKWNTTEF